MVGEPEAGDVKRRRGSVYGGHEPGGGVTARFAAVPLGSQASGLGPATVTNRPSMKVSVTLKVPFAFDVVAASKVRMYVSLAQSLPQVPESGELLLIGP